MLSNDSVKMLVFMINLLSFYKISSASSKTVVEAEIYLLRFMLTGWLLCVQECSSNIVQFTMQEDKS